MPCISQCTFLNSPIWMYKIYISTEERTEISKVFAALSLDPWHKGRQVDEENNPATVRWIDMMRTYVDMWGCTRLITPEASWDTERLKRPYPLSLSLPFSVSLLSSRPFASPQLVYPCFSRVRLSRLLFPHVTSTNLPSKRIASPRWDFQTGA